jgi:GNAT superfamily N-acetyltransferase
VEQARAGGTAADGAAALGRTSEFLRRGLELTADSLREIDGGTVALTPALPQVWSLNHIRLVEPLPAVAALELAEDHLAALSFRHIVADTDAIGRALEQPLRRAGFKIERELVMAMAGSPPTRANGPRVIESDEDAMLELERRWIAEDRRLTAEVVDQILEAARREGRGWGERRFVLTGEDGRPAAMTKLRCDGHTAQVEDVYTVPELRGRGFASTLVSHAVAVAQQSGHDLVFILADDDDWPKHLYARLGFAPIGRKWVFHTDVR